MPISDNELLRELVIGGMDERAAKALLTRMSTASGAPEPKLYVGSVGDDQGIGTDDYVPLVEQTFGNPGPWGPSMVSDLIVVAAGGRVVSELWYEAINFAVSTSLKFPPRTISIVAWKTDGSQRLGIIGPPNAGDVTIGQNPTPGTTTDFDLSGFTVVAGLTIGTDLSHVSTGIQSAAGGAFQYAILMTPTVLAL